jgi:hypothetical protein
LAVVTNIVRSGLDSPVQLLRLLGCVWHVIASASSARTNGALAAAARTPNTLTDHQLYRLPLQSTPSCTITLHRHTKTTAHNLSSSSQPWWRRYIVRKEHSRQPQATSLPTSNKDLAYQAPDRNTSTAAVPYITPRSSRRHIPLLKRASLHPLSHEVDVSGLPLGCTIGHTPSYPS